MSDHKALAYRPDIDGLRAVSIASVVVFHAFPTLLGGGFVGVDVFFVISGYLITGIILREMQGSGFSYLDFYFRRFRRIIPAQFTVLVFTLIAGLLALLPDEYISLGRHLAAGASFTSNLRLLHEIGYFDRAADLKPLLHLWSLSVEEQFYLFWPPILVILHRFRLPIFPVLAMILMASFVSMEMLDADRAFYLLQARFWELMIGGVLACIEASPTANARLRSIDGTVIEHAMGGLGLVLLAVAIFGFSQTTVFPGWRALLPTLGAAALIAVRPRDWINRVLLGNPACVRLGLISYPLYLWHWPLLAYARIIHGDEPPVAVRVGAVLVAVALAWLTWKLIELPVRRSLFTGLRRPWQQRAVIGLAVLSMGAIFGIGDNASHPRAWGLLRPAQNNLAAQDIGESSFDEEVGRRGYQRTGCGAAVYGDHLPLQCWTRRDAGVVHAAIYGDSHAVHFVPGILELAPDPTAWMIVGHPSCPPAQHFDVELGGRDVACADANRQVLAYFAAHPEITTVALSSLGAPYFTPGSRFVVRSDTYAGSPESVFHDGLAETIRDLQAMGRHVVLMIDNPELPFSIGSCVRSPWLRALVGAAQGCEVPRAEYDATAEEYRALVAQLQDEFPTLLVYDPLKLFCDAKECHFMQNGRSLYRDREHLSVIGSRMVAADFLKWLGP